MCEPQTTEWSDAQGSRSGKDRSWVWIVSQMWLRAWRVSWGWAIEDRLGDRPHSMEEFTAFPRLCSKKREQEMQAGLTSQAGRLPVRLRSSCWSRWLRTNEEQPPCLTHQGSHGPNTSFSVCAKQCEVTPAAASSEWEWVWELSPRSLWWGR